MGVGGVQLHTRPRFSRHLYNSLLRLYHSVFVTIRDLFFGELFGNLFSRGWLTPTYATRPLFEPAESYPYLAACLLPAAMMIQC